MIDQVFSRLKLLFAKGKVLRIGADTVQARVLDDETLSAIERVEPYGFSYRPQPGCQGYLLFPDGDRSYGVAIVIGDKQYQMQLQGGEVAIHDELGNYVHIKRGGVIEVKASTRVEAQTPLFKTSADAEVGGNLVVKGLTTSFIGYGGAGGGPALLGSGLQVSGVLTCNGTDVSNHHKHVSNAPGALTSEVV